MLKNRLRFLAVIFAVLMAAAIFTGCEANDEKQYLIAQERLIAGDYDGAAEIFTELGEYENSADMVIECSYAKAGSLLDAGEYDSAADIYGQLGSYKDSADMVIECSYEKAGSLLDAGEYDSAAELFASLLNYKDSADMVNECSYAKADDLYNTGEYYAAAQLFLELGEYKDSHTRCLGTWHKFRPGNTIGATWNCIAAIKNDGTVLCTDPNEYKGIENWTDIISLQFGPDYIVGLKSDGTVVATGNNKYGNCNVEDWTDIVMISVHDSGNLQYEPYCTVGLQADGTVVAVGRNRCGQCDVSELRDIIYISTELTTTVAIKSDGTIILTSDFDKNLKTYISEWTDVKEFAYAGLFYAALRHDGTAIGGGDGYLFQTHINNWTDLTALCANENGTAGLKSDGTVIYTGLLGEGSAKDTGFDEDSEIADMTDIAAIFLSGNDTLIGLKSDGTLDIVTPYPDGFVSGMIDTALTWTDLKLPE